MESVRRGGACVGERLYAGHTRTPSVHWGQFNKSAYVCFFPTLHAHHWVWALRAGFILLLLYHTEGMVKYCNGAWKKWYFCFVFSKHQKNYWNYFDKKKKIERNHGVVIYKKALKSEQKNYILRDINYFIKISVLVH